jgi:hypothetical protein
VVITDTLNGSTIEDLRRNQDGSVSFYCDSGRSITLCVENGRIEVSPSKLIMPDATPIEEFPSVRMRLLEAFQGFMVSYAYYDEEGCVTFVCEPLRHDTEQYAKSSGHREIRLAHTDGIINELPPVSAKISLIGMSVLGDIVS